MMGYGFEQSHEIQSQIEKEAGLEGRLDYMVSSYSSGTKSRLFFTHRLCLILIFIYLMKYLLLVIEIFKEVAIQF